ncbi:MAG: amino acid adenylation domain-containing protein [Chloroflexota bacterium]|nr:amino acid adenylation domain-containing protein [Chloroflexota bacterium]
MTPLDFTSIDTEPLTATALLAQLAALQVEVRLLGDELDVSAPKGVLTAPLIDQIRARKPEIITLLRAGIASASTPAIAARPWETGDRLPLSFTQQYTWVLHQFEADSAVLNIVSARRLRGALNLDALQKSCDSLLMRHQSLRTTFMLHDDLPVQVVQAARRLDLRILDAVNEEEAQRHSQAAAIVPFDLTISPLLRVVLIRLAADHHLLLLTIHHLVTDEWSQDRLWRDLGAAYTAFARGGTADLPTLPIAFADFVVWQRETLIDAALQRHIDFWRTHLAAVPSRLELPIDAARPRVPTHAGAEWVSHIDDAVTRRLTAFARAGNTTPFAVLLASFALLLARTVGAASVVVGTPLSGRTQAETEDVVGLFANVLALHLHTGGNFLDLVQHTHTVILDATEHDALPFEQVLQHGQPTQHADSSPFIQAAFVLRNPPHKPARFADLEVTSVRLAHTTAKFELLLEVIAAADGWQAVFIYNRDLFAASTIERLAAHWGVLLDAALTSPDRPLSLLSIMTDDERQRIVIDWNATQRPYPRDATLAHRFETWAVGTPEAIALIEGETSLTYADLDVAANGVAAALQRLGVQPETVVGIFLPRSTRMVIAALGVVKAGGAYVALDVYHPPSHRMMLIAESDVGIILTTRAWLPELAATGAHLIDLEAIPPQTGGVVSAATAESLVQIIYTSGSTGIPKGTEITHRNIARLVSNTNYVALGASETLLGLSSVSFDASAFEIWGSLLNGARLVIYPGRYVDHDDLAALIAHHRISILFLTTSLFHHLIDHAPAMLDSVAHVIVGGEALSAAHALRAHARGLRLTNGYGPTENTTFTTFHHVTGQEISAIPIGRPIANTQVYLLDDALNLVPIGVVGELAAGGDGVARGYRNRPELTAERFIDHPLYGRLYRTGDYAVWRSDGSIHYLGRRDAQVKVRGFRIEPTAVEQAILQIDGVRQAAVLLREVASGERLLVGYVVSILEVDAIRTHLRATLPSYMIPDGFIPLDALPLTANGKLDRAALPAFTPSQRSLRAPTTPLEQRLVAIWEQTLNRTGISIDDDFFAIGGNSLNAAQIAAIIKRKMRVSLRVIALFHAPTIAQLARTIDDQRANVPEPLVVLLRQGTDASRPPLFLLHGVGGEILNYAPLARHLHAELTVYGIQGRRIDDLKRIPTLVTLAAEYVAAVRAVQPQGAYFLAGHSFGGWVAYEMAQQLRRDGERIGLLALFDTPARYISDSIADRVFTWLRFQVKRIASHSRALLLRSPDRWLDYMRGRWRRVQRRRTVYRSVVEARRGQPGGYRQTVMAFAPDEYKRLSELYTLIGKEYRMQPYTGNFTVYMVQRIDAMIFRRRWRRLAGNGVTFQALSGTHITLVEPPHVEGLAADLNDKLGVGTHHHASDV